MTTYYRLYAKFEGQNKFQALDLSKGTQVINLIHATMIPSYNVQKVAKMMYELNPNLEWKITKIK